MARLTMKIIDALNEKMRDYIEKDLTRIFRDYGDEKNEKIIIKQN